MLARSGPGVTRQSQEPESFVETIRAYEGRLGTAMQEASRQEDYREVILGPIRVKVPARLIIV
jgi:hypothetical protein